MKKLNKFFAVLVALAMMATLCVSMAFAKPNPQTDAKEVDLADANITKSLVVPTGVTTNPVVDVSFNFDLDTSKSIGLNSADTETTLAIADLEDTITGNAGTTVTEEFSISNGITLPTFTHSGVYAYTVTENDPEVTTPNNGKGVATKDSATYTIYFYVVPDSPSGYKVDFVTVATANGDKVAPESGLAFTDNYTYTNGSDPEDPGEITPEEKQAAALVVEKNVLGDAAAPATDTFPIKVTLTKPVGAAADATVTAYKYNADGTQDGEAETYAFGEKTFDLKKGQYIAFFKLPAGTTYGASELLANADQYKGYTPAVTVTTNGVEEDNAAGAGETLPTKTAAYLLSQDANDTVLYKNTYSDAFNTPTGILMNNLPYIVLALVAIGGLVAYVVVRRRNADEA